MKPKIHPEFSKVMVTCACGQTFESFSTAKELKVEVCSTCHPFFTGTQRFVDTAGRVEKFKAKIETQKKIAADKVAKAKAAGPRVAGKPSASKNEAPPENVHDEKKDDSDSEK